MNAQISGVAGRTPAQRKLLRPEYFDRGLELLAFAAQLAQLPLLLARHARRLTSIDLSLAHPPAQCLCAHPQPARDPLDRPPLGLVVTDVLADQPHRPGLGVLVVPDRHRAILPSKEGGHKTRDGSFVPVRAWRGDHKIDLTGRQGFCKFVARGLAEVELHLGPAEIEDTIVRLRKTLVKAGYDAGAATIAAHLTRDPDVTTPLLLWEVGHVEGAAGHHRRRARRAQQKRGSVLALSGNDQLTESI
jgi:hypothetical protein